MFQDYDVVRLKHDMPSAGVTTRMIGAIVMVYPGAEPPAYEVEFVDEGGKTVALLTLNEDQLEPAATERKE